MPSGATGDICPRCAAALLQATQTEISVGPEAKHAFIPPSVAELAPAFRQLEILELLGCGGMGAVYRARQKELDRIVALKILPPGIGDAPAFAERFAREAKALARLNHPGIVTIHDFGRAGGLYYFLMEFVDGVTLRRLLEGGRVSPREALAIVPQICDALQYAHDQGIVHRDIKPENILLDRSGRVKVADFGLAKLVGTGTEPLPVAGSRPPSPTLTAAGKVMGTPAYMAPEQAEHPADVDHRADIYALGVVFYQMLTGKLPPKPLQPPSRKVQIDVRLDEVVLQALEEEPERRYQKASQVKTALETIAATSAPQGAERGTTGTSPRSAGDMTLGHPLWQHVPLAGILAVLLWVSAALTLNVSVPLAWLLLAGGLASAIFIIARRTRLDIFLASLAIVFFLWLGVVFAMAAGGLPLGVAAGVLALGILAFVVKKLHPPRGFLRGFMAVFSLVFSASVVITFLLPESFASATRLQIGRAAAGASGVPMLPSVSGTYDPYFIATEFEVIQSELILGRVVDDLNLQEIWSKTYANGEKLTRPEAIGVLKRKMALHPVRNTTIVEIQVFSEKPTEAATIANEIAEVYMKYRYETMSSATPDSHLVQVVILDRAMPGRRAVRPNKPLDLAIGALAGLLLGAAAGAGVSAYESRKNGTV
jgi:capsular polysaccharide biosynthesis protein